jgi:hypothetical protein
MRPTKKTTLRTRWNTNSLTDSESRSNPHFSSSSFQPCCSRTLSSPSSSRWQDLLWQHLILPILVKVSYEDSFSPTDMSMLGTGCKGQTGDVATDVTGLDAVLRPSLIWVGCVASDYEIFGTFHAAGPTATVTVAATVTAGRETITGR